MSPTENGVPDRGSRAKMLQKLKVAAAKRQAEEDAILMPTDKLAGFRRLHGISQSDLATRLSQQCSRLYAYTQNEVSQMERGKTNRELQLEASKYFRSLGHEVDKAGDSIHIQPAEPTNFDQQAQGAKAECATSEQIADGTSDRVSNETSD